jgi:hypothetical protein
MMKTSTEGVGCVTAQTGSVSNIVDKSYLKNNNAPVQSIKGGHPDGVKRTLSQITLSEGWKNQNPKDDNVIYGPDGQVANQTVSNSTGPGVQTEVEFITTSMLRRGNRNKAMLIREKREKLKQRRTNAYKRCDRVSSDEVPSEWVQDRSKNMVIIGTDAVSLYPSMEKREAADEVAEAVRESNLKWEGVNWKEATRFLVLGRDEAW